MNVTARYPGLEGVGIGVGGGGAVGSAVVALGDGLGAAADAVEHDTNSTAIRAHFMSTV